MRKTQTDLAESLDIDRKTIYNTKKTTEKVGSDLEKQLEQTAELKKNVRSRIKKMEEAKPLKVKPISNIEGSTFFERLQQAKEDYDFNLKMIARMRAEIETLDSTATMNSNYTTSVHPQVKAILDYQKQNISLRNQIEDLENRLGYGAENDEQSPFV